MTRAAKWIGWSEVIFVPLGSLILLGMTLHVRHLANELIAANVGPDGKPFIGADASSICIRIYETMMWGMQVLHWSLGGRDFFKGLGRILHHEVNIVHDPDKILTMKTDMTDAVKFTILATVPSVGEASNVYLNPESILTALNGATGEPLNQKIEITDEGKIVLHDKSK